MKPTQRGRPDFILLFVTIAMVGFGLLMVFSSSSATAIYEYGSPWYFARKQILFAIIGLFMMLVLMNIRVDLMRRLSFLILIISISFLIAVLLFGVEIKGAKSWLYVAGFSVQPVEFVKIGILIYLASFISKKEDRLRNFSQGLLPVILVISVVCVLIMQQPDFGSMCILLFTVFIMLFVGGMHFKHIFVITACLVPVCILLVVSQSYRMQRLTSFLNPWEDPLGTGHQLIQALYAFGHGGIDGVGFGQSLQKLHYLPEAHNDFIFPIIAEEFGFIGTLIFLLLYLFFLYRGWLISMRSNQMFAFSLGTGIVTLIAVQALINMGGATGSLPITGVPLPFISAGGSSLIVSMSAAGILLSISRENHRRSLQQNTDPH